MRMDLAENIKIGDKICNCFMDTLIVTSIFKDKPSKKLIFSTIDSRLNRAGYSYLDVYLQDLEGESDDEKSWIDCVSKNKGFLSDVDDIDTCKKFYKIGFCKGFEYKKQITFEENMQK